MPGAELRLETSLALSLCRCGGVEQRLPLHSSTFHLASARADCQLTQLNTFSGAVNAESIMNVIVNDEVK